MHIFRINKIKNNSIYLYNDDIHHILKVLHKKTGDVIFCTDNISIYETKIKKTSPLILEITSINECKTIPYEVNCFVGVIDKKSFETLIVNLNQLNCKSITPVLFSRSQGNIHYDYSRLNKIILESNKQCGRINGIILNKEIYFNEMLSMIKEDNWFVAYENDKTNNSFNIKESANIIIGPEGGITIDEYNLLTKIGVKSIALTNTILKTEIATTYLASVIINKLKNKE